MLLLLLPFWSCKKTAPETLGTLTVEMEQCVQQTDGRDRLTLCLESLVEDSRCPADAVCVWQGLARARFSLRLNDQPYSFELATSNLAPHHIDTTIQSYRFTLLNVTPYSDTGSNEKMVATVQVSKQ